MIFTQKERLAVYLVLAKPGAWGGNEETILAQDEIYSALRLAEFERSVAEKTDISKFTGKPLVVKVMSVGATSLLLEILSSAGQSAVTARHSASAIRTIRSDAGYASALKKLHAAASNGAQKDHQ